MECVVARCDRRDLSSHFARVQDHLAVVACRHAAASSFVELAWGASVEPVSHCWVGRVRAFLRGVGNQWIEQHEPLVSDRVVPCCCCLVDGGLVCGPATSRARGYGAGRLRAAGRDGHGPNLRWAEHEHLGWSLGVRCWNLLHRLPFASCIARAGGIAHIPCRRLGYGDEEARLGLVCNEPSGHADRSMAALKRHGEWMPRSSQRTRRQSLGWTAGHIRTRDTVSTAGRERRIARARRRRDLMPACLRVLCALRGEMPQTISLSTRTMRKD